MSYNPLAEKFDKLKSKLEKKEEKKKEKDLLAGLINTEITLYLRNGQSLKGILRKVTRYEILVDTLEGPFPLVVMKHAIDLVKEVSH
jgi:sRNA-binding regulator protein Hfq